MNLFAPGLRRVQFVCALLLAGGLLIPGCAPRSLPAALPLSEGAPGVVSSVAPALPAATVPPEKALPGVGILSHEHEELVILRKAERAAASPSTAEKDAAPRGVRRAALPHADAPSEYKTALSPLNPPIDVYALSPHARLLARPVRPLRGPGRPSRQHGGKEPGAMRRAPSTPPPSSPVAWGDLAREAEEIFGLDAALVLAVIQAESAFNHAAESPAGAQGAMQVMPGTQVELGLIDPFDPRANIYAGSQYLMALIQRFGSVELALAAYNAGPASVEKYGGVPPFQETRDFVRRVMASWKEGKKR